MHLFYFVHEKYSKWLSSDMISELLMNSYACKNSLTWDTKCSIQKTLQFYNFLATIFANGRNGNYWWFLKVVTSFILFYGFSDNWSKGGGMWVSGRCYESTGVRLSCSTHGLDSDEWTFKSLSLSLHSQHRSVSRRIDNLLIEDSKKLIFFGLALFLFMIQYKSIHFFVIHAIYLLD